VRRTLLITRLLFLPNPAAAGARGI